MGCTREHANPREMESGEPLKKGKPEGESPPAGKGKKMNGYRVMMKREDGTIEQYGLYENEDWARVQLKKARDWYWMDYETFYIEKA